MCHHGGVQTETDQRQWTKSSACSGGTCVEVAPTHDGVLLRDGKHPDLPALESCPLGWGDLIHGIKAGDFDFSG